MNGQQPAGGFCLVNISKACIITGHLSQPLQMPSPLERLNRTTVTNANVSEFYEDPVFRDWESLCAFDANKQGSP
jgi:hypothetical protein